MPKDESKMEKRKNELKKDYLNEKLCLRGDQQEYCKDTENLYHARKR